jgi:hypothetical protein
MRETSAPEHYGLPTGRVSHDLLLILSARNSHIRRLKSAFTSMGADVIFFVEHTHHPEKYGVI